jgi:hypothetical protein
MKLSTGRMQLHSSYKDLKPRWEDVQDSWDDVVQRDFDEKYLKPLDEQIQATLRAMDRLAEVMAQLHQDCA